MKTNISSTYHCWQIGKETWLVLLFVLSVVISYQGYLFGYIQEQWWVSSFLNQFFFICKHSKANNTNALNDPKCVPHILTSMPNLVITLQRCLTEFSHVNTSTRRIGIQWRCIVMYHTVSMHQKAKTSPSTFAVSEEHLRHVSSISRP